MLPLTPWVSLDHHGEVLHLKSDTEWQAFAELYAPDAEPLAQVLKVARDGGCRTVVVEHRYIDLDFRSEHAAYWSLRFEVPSPFTRRLHFFAAEFDDEAIHALPADAGYLGYSVLKPMKVGRVGRTVLKPPPALADATLTQITERVSLYGNDLEVIGVPFLEQDGEYLRCAHAAAWICHYVAVGRDLVGRRSTATMVGLTPDVLSDSRPLPSQGLNLNQLQAVFGATGQPALLYGFSSLPNVIGVEKKSPMTDDEGRPLPNGHWDTRCISIICRYLNSGFPVLVAGDGHAWVLVGWKREPDSGHVTFIGCDDQKGPYEEIPYPWTHYRCPWHSIMVPLPPKVFLTGEAAENAAFIVLHGVWASDAGDAALADRLMGGEIQLRTRVKNIRAFKREIASQTSSDDVLRAIRLARLPNFVWVVEAHDRDRCHSDESCVVATVLYDATSSDTDPRLCAIATPGAVAVFPPDGGATEVIRASKDPWRSMLPVH